MIFSKWKQEWPRDVQIMYTKFSQGQFICVLSISKLRMTISHEELAKIDIYGQNTSNPVDCRVSNRPTWLLATYIYEARSQVHICETDPTTLLGQRVPCYKKLTRRRKMIPGTVLESSRPMFFDPKKISMIRTHPEELRGSGNC